MALFRQPAVYLGYDFRRKCPCKPGDVITCVVAVEAGYSGYSGNPVCVFQPGMEETAVVTDAISVRYGPYGEDVGVSVHFTGPPHGKEGGTTWRVFLRYGNIKVLKRSKLSSASAQLFAKVATIARCYGRGGVTKAQAAPLIDAELAAVNGDSIRATIGYP